jgi:hypothetical protein
VDIRSRKGMKKMNDSGFKDVFITDHPLGYLLSKLRNNDIVKFFFTEMYNYIKHYEKDFNTKISYGILPRGRATLLSQGIQF